MKTAMFFLDVSDGRSFSRESVQTCRTKNAAALKIPVTLNSTNLGIFAA